MRIETKWRFAGYKQWDQLNKKYTLLLCDSKAKRSRINRKDITSHTLLSVSLLYNLFDIPKIQREKEIYADLLEALLVIILTAKPVSISIVFFFRSFCMVEFYEWN